jgi:hypothetical protein
MHGLVVGVEVNCVNRSEPAGSGFCGLLLPGEPGLKMPGDDFGQP